MVAGRSIRISQYTDDSTFFVRDLGSVTTLLALLNSFTTFSGLRINLQKSHLLLLGNFLHPPSKVGGIQVVDKIKILGVYFQNQMTEEDQYALKYKAQLDKIYIPAKLGQIGIFP